MKTANAGTTKKVFLKMFKSAVDSHQGLDFFRIVNGITGVVSSNKKQKKVRKRNEQKLL